CALIPALASCSKHSPTAPAVVLPAMSGTVFDARGTPAPDVFVTLTRKLFPAPDDSFYSNLAYTDSAGAFSFFDVPKGNFGLFAAIFPDPGGFFPTDSLVAFMSVSLARPGIRLPPYTLTLRPGGTFAGMTRDSSTSSPIDALLLLDGALGAWGGSD